MNEKIKQFKKRNRRRNAHLYQSGLTEKLDYILCPVSKERMSMIKSSYIERVLLITVTEYDALYPGVRGVSASRKNNIKTGLHKVDLDTGKTKYEIGQEKARKILSNIDETGLSGYQQKGQKTRAAHMSNIDEFGRNGYSQLACTAIVKGNQTKADKGLISDPENRDEFHRYKAVVLFITNRHRKIVSAGYKVGLAGVAGAWHLDHVYPIFAGFANKISPLVIGNINNLKMLPWRENISKFTNTEMTTEDILKLTNYSLDQSLNEFYGIIELIQDDIQNNTTTSAGMLLERYNDTTLRKKL